MPFVSKIEYLPTTTKFFHPIEEGNYYVTTTLEDDGWEKRTSMCKEFSAPRNQEDSKPYASFDANKEIGPVSNVEIATIIDVLGIEVQVPSLSSPGYSVWILQSRGHERFVNEIHRHNSDIVNYSSPLRAKECNLNDVCFESSKTAVVNHWQGSQDSNNVKTKFEPSSMHLETVAFLDTGSSGLHEMQQREQRRPQQSCVNTSKSKVQSRAPRRTENLDYNSWMPEMQEGFI